MINLKKSVLGASVLCASLIATSFGSANAVQAQNIVINGGFESGTGQTIPGWALTGTVDTGIETGSDVYQGTQSVYFGEVGSTATLSQNLSTIIGTAYMLSYALGNPFGGSPSSFDVLVGGVNVQSLTNPAIFPYTVFTRNFTAASTSTSLAFVGRHDPDYFYLDAVSVTPVPVTPVPVPISCTGCLIVRPDLLINYSALQYTALNVPEYPQYQKDDFSRSSLEGRILPFKKDLEDK